jgi:hypothetical protein
MQPCWGTSGSFSSCATFVSTTRVSKPNSSCGWCQIPPLPGGPNRENLSRVSTTLISYKRRAIARALARPSAVPAAMREASCATVPPCGAAVSASRHCRVVFVTPPTAPRFRTAIADLPSCVEPLDHCERCAPPAGLLQRWHAPCYTVPPMRAPGPHRLSHPQAEHTARSDNPEGEESLMAQPAQCEMLVRGSGHISGLAHGPRRRAYGRRGTPATNRRAMHLCTRSSPS